MAKCECYHEEEIFYPINKATPRCYGTKEREVCSCGGDRGKCDFYIHNEEEVKTMNTAEMWIEAQKTNKTYQCGDIAYQKDIGFVGSDDFADKMYAEDGEDFEDLLKLDNWVLVKDVYTRAGAEAKFNIKIIG